MSNQINKYTNTGSSSVRVCLFFTYGISLKTWDRLGLLDREILLYKYLARQSIEVAFFTYGDKTDFAYSERLSGIKIIPAYAEMKRCENRILAFLQSLLFPFKFKKILSQYNIFKTNQMWGAWVPLIVKWVCGGKLLVRCGYEQYYTLLTDKGSFITRCWFYLFSKIAYLAADHIILTAEYIKKFVESTFKASSSKISLISNFIDTELFSPDSSISLRDRRIIFIGRLNKQKNLFNLIEATKNADIGLDLVGTGELKTELQSFAKQINADVHFMGTYPNSQLPALINRYSIFILASLDEGNPKALLEAMSCGIAVIGADVNGIHEIIKDGENGILCGTNVNEITQAILKLIGNIQLRQRVGENARRYVIEHCDIKFIFKKELFIYKKILGIKVDTNEINKEEHAKSSPGSLYTPHFA